MPARVTCVKGERIEVALADVFVWADRWQVGYGYWCPCCQVPHRGLTTRKHLIELLDRGVRVDDPGLWGE